MVKRFVVTLMVAACASVAAVAAASSQPPVILAQATPADSARPKVVDAGLVTVRGTVEAVDTEKKTVTLKGPKRSVTMQVRDPQKLEAIKVGDPVVGKYYESLVIAVKKPVLNQDWGEALDNQVSRHKVTWTWTKGHASHADNNHVDELASDAASMQSFGARLSEE